MYDYLINNNYHVSHNDVTEHFNIRLQSEGIYLSNRKRSVKTNLITHGYNCQQERCIEMDTNCYRCLVIVSEWSRCFKC